MMLHSKTFGRPAAAGPKLVASRSTAAVTRKVSARFQAEETVAATVTSPLLTKLEAESSKGQVYGKPLSKSEVSALKAAIAHLEQGSRAGISTAEGLRTQLMSFLKEAATTKSIPLNIVEGSMVLLEQLYLMDARPKGPLKGVMTRQDTLCRWQLVIGADVGSIQYIPVVEEFEVFPDGTSFALDTDLGWLFTGFSGDASWFSPGHARYHVRRVRLELRLPKALQFWKKDRDAPPEKDDGKGTCRPDPSKPAVTLPLPFPENELFIFASNGDIAPMRSKLGGLILLVNKTPVEERSKLF